MTKKKEETNEKRETMVTKKDIDALQAKVDEHAVTIANFRTSFENFETKIRTLIERNRLR